ncbi:MAG: Hpt domain-containing protein, partial [Nitrospirae bacterium]|nr:Hpt domain-containing protein [Nitrospirota bacterium]
MSDDFAQFNAAFFEEAAEHMAVMETGLLDLEQRPTDLDLLNKIFRSAHSIKGVASMLGFLPVAQFTHKMETLLDLLRNGRITVTQPMTDLLLKSTDCLKALIEAAQNETTVDEAMVHPLEVQLEQASTPGAALSGAQAQAPAPVTAPAPSPSPVAAPSAGTSRHRFMIKWTPPAFLFQRGLDPQQILKELGDLGGLSGVTLDSSHLPDLANMDPEQCYLAWTLVLDTPKSKEVVEGVFE